MAKIRDEYKFDIFLDVSEEKKDSPYIIDYKPKAGAVKLIEFQNVTKEFGNSKKKKFRAVDNLSFAFYEGENVAFLGANGAGKTTTIEMIAGISKPTKGKILYLYDYVYSFQEGIGIQFQDSSYPIGLHVKNIIEFMIDSYNIDITEEESFEVVKSFGLESLYNKPANMLSGGQQQRLNILLALLHKPKIVFLDELSTGLDIHIKSEIKRFVKDYCKKYKINIILISHDLQEVLDLTERIMIIQGGKLKVDIRKEDIKKYHESAGKLLNDYI
ncbi:MAG: ABC transporter ATP-binding protein [Mycoplasmoidaceae bacterium]